MKAKKLEGLKASQDNTSAKVAPSARVLLHLLVAANMPGDNLTHPGFVDRCRQSSRFIRLLTRKLRLVRADRYCRHRQLLLACKGKVAGCSEMTPGFVLIKRTYWSSRQP
jgi:hypothetical protein